MATALPTLHFYTGVTRTYKFSRVRNAYWLLSIIIRISYYLLSLTENYNEYQYNIHIDVRI